MSSGPRSTAAPSASEPLRSRTRRHTSGVLGQRWGVTDAEVGRRYPCDDLVPAPALEVWRGVTVDASPEQVWRWLIQVRLAPYSYDWIDNLGRRSPQELRDLDDPKPGDTFTTAGARFGCGEVLSVAHAEHLTARILGATISYVLVPEGGSTRLLMKLVLLEKHWWNVPLAIGDWPMARRQLLNFKQLAETSAPAGSI